MGDLEIEEGLLKRFRDLEASQEKLREQLGFVVSEGIGIGIEREDIKKRNLSREYADFDAVTIPGFFANDPYRSVLQHIGHAIHVSRPISGEIIYWNQSAENLYGWKEYEALGQRVTTLLIDESNHPFFENIMERLNNGQKWSGQFPFRKRSGQMFMAMITKSPLYENSELIGVITVSCDSAILNDMKNERSKAYWNESHHQQRESKLDFGMSTVFNLASKLLPRIHAYSNGEGENSRERCGCLIEVENVLSDTRGVSASNTIFSLHSGFRAIEEIYKYEEIITKFTRQSKIAAKLLSKLNIRGNGLQESDKGMQTDPVNSVTDSSSPIPPDKCTCSNGNHSRMSKDGSLNSKQSMKTEESCASDFSSVPKKMVEDELNKSSIKCMRCSESGCSFNVMKSYNINCERNGKDNSTPVAVQKKQILKQQAEDCPSISANSVETNCGNQTRPSQIEKKDLKLLTACDIRWEDLHIGEEVGQGSYAVVYRGVWNGSDVAIKLYLGNDYQEGLLLDYKKEIAIMKRLRHPNVLLFMGAVYSPERLAIVTEFLPRGSLLRTLHKNTQKLDLKRRLRMALDVAIGMNYLHRRNPPIIHRDLKSSNLLVDKNWTVKVGDFGLSCLKISTDLTATSGRGTPQWMAPEVLRGECSSEKSDVFSFGVILWELMTESVPWTHLNPLQVIGVVGFMDRRLDLPASMDPRVSSIICDCWDSDPTRRPSFQEIVGRMVELIGAMTPALPCRRLERRRITPV